MRNKDPLVSIAITTYSRVDLLKQSILSVLNQSYKNIELLIGNDNITRKITSLFPDLIDDRIVWIDNIENLGYIGNYNNLLENAKGDYFVSLSDDDLFHTDFLELMMSGLIETGADCIFSNYQIFQNEDLSIRCDYSNQLKCFNSDEWLIGYLKREINVIGCYGLIPTSFLRKIGGSKELGSDKGFSPYNDNLIAVQVADLKCIAHLERPLIFYRYHLESPSYSSVDFKAYSTAQKDFIDVANLIFTRHLKLTKLVMAYEYLSNWFLGDFLTVMKRGKTLSISDLITYFKFYFDSRKRYSPLSLISYQYIKIIYVFYFPNSFLIKFKKYINSFLA